MQVENLKAVDPDYGNRVQTLLNKSNAEAQKVNAVPFQSNKMSPPVLSDGPSSRDSIAVSLSIHPPPCFSCQKNRHHDFDISDFECNVLTIVGRIATKFGTYSHVPRWMDLQN